MKEIETLGLIVMLYDYKLNLKYENAIAARLGDGKDIPAWRLAMPVKDYLKRKGYLSKHEGRPTLKFYKLLNKYCVEIPQLIKSQLEYATTKHVTQYDKFGNKEIL